MKAEELLQAPRHIEWLIRTIGAEIEQARCSLLPGGINYEMDRIQGGTVGDRYADVMAKIDALEGKAARLDERRNKLLNEVIPRLLAVCEDEAARVINLHDVEGIPMETLALRRYRSRSNLYEIRRAGLAAIQSILDSMDGGSMVELDL